VPVLQDQQVEGTLVAFLDADNELRVVVFGG
jgi:hypothetical protein